MNASIWIGFDPRPAEADAFEVARNSIERRLSKPVTICPLTLDALQKANLYTRPLLRRDDGAMWDEISQAPMSTEFAISRFLVPYLARSGWALFVDCDVMARVDLMELFDACDPYKACMVVKHDYTPKHATKMEGAVQTVYEKKNWSSVIAWNCDHRLTQWLTPEMVNTRRGLWLHQFKWLRDDDIGALDPAWNHLVGDQEPNPSAKMVHFTNGTPNMPGHEGCEYADEWRAEQQALAA